MQKYIKTQGYLDIWNRLKIHNIQKVLETRTNIRTERELKQS